ncbi:hypothetical protein BVX98_06365 [bacterium F11]|nr:hypothetical protein BVX98_06365 [bacterium F11]
MQSLFCEKDPHPHIGWRFIPEKEGAFKNKEFWTTVRINSLGMRGSEVDLSQDKKRLLILGDSIAVGWGVEEESMFSTLMGKELKNWMILNMSVPGYCTRSQFFQLDKMGEKYHPSVVLLSFYHNDPIENAYPEDFQIHNPQYYKGMERLYGYHFLRRILDGSLFKKEARPYYRGSNREIWALTEEYLEKIMAWCQQRKVRFHLAYFPVKDEINEKEPVGYRKKLVEYCLREKVSYIDLTEVIQSQPEPRDVYFEIDEHLSSQGHLIVARKLMEYLDLR